MSRIVARRLGLPYLNSGYIYRAVTVLALEAGVAFDDHARVAEIIGGMDLQFREDGDITRVVVGDREITTRLKDPDVTPQVFKIANEPYFRSLLVELQRRCAEPNGVVAEGRDMGSVIFPMADHKFYMDASPEERARRQHRDLEARGHARSYADVLEEVLRRDAHDRNRAVAPLCVPVGAVEIRTDALSVKEIVEDILGRVAAPVGEGRKGGLRDSGK